MKSLRTSLALHIAPWLKPQEPQRREWKISGNKADNQAFERAHGVTWGEYLKNLGDVVERENNESWRLR